MNVSPPGRRWQPIGITAAFSQRILPSVSRSVTLRLRYSATRMRLRPRYCTSNGERSPSTSQRSLPSGPYSATLPLRPRVAWATRVYPDSARVGPAGRGRDGAGRVPPLPPRGDDVLGHVPVVERRRQCFGVVRDSQQEVLGGPRRCRGNSPSRSIRTGTAGLNPASASATASAAAPAGRRLSERRDPPRQPAPPRQRAAAAARRFAGSRSVSAATSCGSGLPASNATASSAVAPPRGRFHSRRNGT